MGMAQGVTTIQPQLHSRKYAMAQGVTKLEDTTEITLHKNCKANAIIIYEKKKTERTVNTLIIQYKWL